MAALLTPKLPSDVALHRRCGPVRGLAIGVSPSSGFRFVCYCKDCQAFARFLGRADVLERVCGTDIFQMPPGRVKLTTGTDAQGRLRCRMLKRRRGFVVIAVLMMIFGAAEVRTGFRHEFLGLREPTRPGSLPSEVRLACYLSAGALVLVYRRRALFAASVTLAIDVVGRIGLVLGGEFPIGNARQALGIGAGTAIAAFFGVVVAKYSFRAKFRGSDRTGNRPLISPRVCWGVTPLTSTSTAHHRVNTESDT